MLCSAPVAKKPLSIPRIEADRAPGAGAPGSNAQGWRSPLLTFLPLWLGALVTLTLRDQAGVAALLVGNAGLLAVLVWVTWRQTPAPPPPAPEPPRSRATLAWQLGAIAVVVVLVGMRATDVPVWSALIAGAHAVGESLLDARWVGGPGNALANPLQYLVIPLLVLLALGARPSALGFGRGHRVGITSLLWMVVPAAVAVVALATGALTVQRLVARILGNTLQNGPFEEFLFRGALQTRLMLLIPLPWAILLQALVFGLWHLMAATDAMGGDPIAAVAFCIASQTVTGLAIGIVYWRTGNLVAPSVAHVALNVMGQTLG